VCGAYKYSPTLYISWLTSLDHLVLWPQASGSKAPSQPSAFRHLAISQAPSASYSFPKAFDGRHDIAYTLRIMALEGTSSYVAPGNLTEPSDSLPIFDVQRVQLQFPIAADFVAAQVANNVLVLALSTGRILRIDLDTPEDIDGREHRSPAMLAGSNETS
jgi:hypothetical protein